MNKIYVNLHGLETNIISLTRIEFEIEFRPLIHPYQGDSGKIAIQDITDTPRKSIRGGFPKKMPNMRTRSNFDTAPALPCSK